jgi:hypothetical protein
VCGGRGWRVARSHPDSNYGGAYETLFKDVAIPAAQLYAIDQSLCPTNEGTSAACATAYDAVLKGAPPDYLTPSLSSANSPARLERPVKRQRPAALHALHERGFLSAQVKG